MWLLWSDNVLYLYVIFHREGSQHKLQITAVPQGQAGNPAHAAGEGGGFVQGHLSELCSPGETRVSIPCVWRTYPESPGFVRLSLPKVTGCDGWDLGHGYALLQAGSLCASRATPVLQPPGCTFLPPAPVGESCAPQTAPTIAWLGMGKAQPLPSWLHRLLLGWGWVGLMQGGRTTAGHLVTRCCSFWGAPVFCAAPSMGAVGSGAAQARRVQFPECEPQI